MMRELVALARITPHVIGQKIDAWLRWATRPPCVDGSYHRGPVFIEADDAIGRYWVCRACGAWPLPGTDWYSDPELPGSLRAHPPRH